MLCMRERRNSAGSLAARQLLLAAPAHAAAREAQITPQISACETAAGRRGGRKRGIGARPQVGTGDAACEATALARPAAVPTPRERVATGHAPGVAQRGRHRRPDTPAADANSAGVDFRAKRAAWPNAARSRRGAPLRGHLAAAVVAWSAALHFLGPRARFGIVHDHLLVAPPSPRARARAGGARGAVAARTARSQATVEAGARLAEGGRRLHRPSRARVTSRSDGSSSPQPKIEATRSTRRAPGSRAPRLSSWPPFCQAGRGSSKAIPTRPLLARRRA